MLHTPTLTKHTPESSYYHSDYSHPHRHRPKHPYYLQQEDNYEKGEDAIAEDRHALKIRNLTSEYPRVKCYNHRSSEHCSRQNQKLS